MICRYCRGKIDEAAVSVDSWLSDWSDWQGPSKEQQALHVALCGCWTCKRLNCEPTDRHGKCAGILNVKECPGRKPDLKRLKVQRERAMRADMWRTAYREASKQ